MNSCWDCALRNEKDTSLFGLCAWWDEPKDIPAHIVDKGCKYWRSEFAQKAIDKFKGKLLHG